MVVLTSRSGRAAARPAGRRRLPRARGGASRRRPAARWRWRRPRWPRHRAAGTRRARRPAARRPRDPRPPGARPRGRRPRARSSRWRSATDSSRSAWARAAAFCSAASRLVSRSSCAASCALGVGDRLVGDRGLAVRASACWSWPSSTRSSLPLTAPATSLALPATLSNSPSRASAALSLLMTSGARFGTSDTLLRV